MITVRSKINIAHQSVSNVIPVVQGDTGRSILFSLADFTIPTGATARYFITKPSGLAVYNDATIDGNTVLVDLTAQSLAEYGDCPGQVRISVDDTVVTSFEFILHVEPFRGIDAVESTTETNIFDQAVEDAREAIAEAAEDAEEYISQALDTTLTIPAKAADAKATGDAISDSADAVIAQMRAEIADVYPTETAQGNPATFDDGADEIPVKDLKVSIVPHQEGSGDPSPDNIRPITGTTEVEVERTGVNVINFGSYTGSGDWLANHIIPVTAPYLTRRVTFSGSGQYLFRLYGISNGTETLLDGFGYGATMVDVKPVSQYDHIRVSGYSNNASNSFSECFVGFGESSSALPYEPYKGQTVTTDLGRTVYGGTLDVTSGVLTVDRVAKTLTTARNLSGTYAGSIIYNSGSPETSDADFSKPLMCNRLEYVGSSTSNFRYGTCINAQLYSFNLWIKDGAFANLTEATEWLANNETQIAYYLATPQTYQLTPQEVLSVLGTNHITTNAESVDVSYRADVQLYIENLTKPGEDDMTANMAIASGKFFMVGNRLLLSTASIANGATINPGTNCTELSLSDALNSLA